MGHALTAVDEPLRRGCKTGAELAHARRGAAAGDRLEEHRQLEFEEERVGHTADVVNVDQLPFGGFGGQEPLVLLAANLEFARSLEFDWFCGGHGNTGEKSDVDFYLSYLEEVAALVNDYAPRPTEVPDLSLTDYLAAGLDLEAKSCPSSTTTSASTCTASRSWTE